MRLYNASDPTNWVDDLGNPTIRIVHGIVTASGPARLVTVKGLGVVLLDTGRLSVGPDGLTYHGPHDELEARWDELCAAVH